MALWHPRCGTDQTYNLEAIPCLAAGLLLSFPSLLSPFISFLALALATPAAPSPPEALIHCR